MSEQVPFYEELKFARGLVDKKDYKGAWKVVDDILTESPDDVPALMMAQDILDKERRFQASYQYSARVLQLAPQLSSSWSNYGRMAEQLYMLPQAEMAYKQAIELSKNDDQRLLYSINMAAMYTQRGDWANGELWAKKALALNPESKKAKGNYGLACLGQQKWSEGWVNYDAILGTEYRKDIRYANEPMWDGKPGQTVIVYGEQGLGDELSFASMIPDAIKICKKVIIDCDERLEPLFKRSFPQAKVYGTRWAKGPHWDSDWEDEDKQFDASISIGQLGRYFRLKNEDFPGDAYLKPNPDRATMWRQYFRTKGKPAIGIAWTGGIQCTGEKFRKWPLEQIRPLIEAVDAHWVSLQYKPSRDAIEASGLPITEYGIATLAKDYDETAGLVEALDMVICMQTSVGHLAGALGKEAWVFVSPLSQWRYGGESDKILWYDSVKLWRTKQDGSWPIEDAARVLKLKYSLKKA